jgi:amidophosphoribosyltransferase
LCKAAIASNSLVQENYVKAIYEPFTAQEISAKIAALLTPADVHAQVDIIYQTLEGLHHACPENNGDWYFTGNYPTPGGNRVANKAFINFMEQKVGRGY